MFRRFKSSNFRRRPQGGYILLTLLLMVALLAIFATAAEESLIQQIKRDREEELIHRGVQYSRAVRHYYKKFGRYPTRIEDLQSTNTIRFLRKRYKDPTTGKDFKLLHQGEVQMSFGAGGLGGGGAALNALAANAGITPQNGQTMGAAIAAAAAAAQPGGAGIVNPTDSEAADADSGDKTSRKSSGPGSSSSSSGISPVGSGQVFGGGPIVGVASTNKEQSIRSFNKKDHYNQWQFIYDPTTDRGGLLMTPNQPPLNMGSQTGAGLPANGQPAQAVDNGSGGMNNQPQPPPTQAPPFEQDNQK